MLPKKLYFWLGVCITTGLFCLISIGIEFVQYYFSLGLAEIDDVICNTFGAFIGSVSLLLAHAFKRRKERSLQK